MKKQNFIKRAAVVAMAGAMMVGSTIPVFAAGWQKDGTGWWYGTNEGNTTWHSNGWQWIDENGDNIAECYYFDQNGYILTSVVTPDGYIVNADGAWVNDNCVQTKVVDVSKKSNDVYDVRDYDSQGLSKAAIDILLHTKEENEKYGVAGTNGTQVQYANGLWAEYDYSKDGRPIWVRSDNDSTRVFKEVVHQTKESAEALRAKGYNVSYGATLSVEGFWDERLSFWVSGKGSGTKASWLRLRWPDRCINWGTDWGY